MAARSLLRSAAHADRVVRAVGSRRFMSAAIAFLLAVASFLVSVQDLNAQSSGTDGRPLPPLVNSSSQTTRPSALQPAGQGDQPPSGPVLDSRANQDEKRNDPTALDSVLRQEISTLEASLWRWRWLGIASVALILICLGTLLWHVQSRLADVNERVRRRVPFESLTHLESHLLQHTERFRTLENRLSRFEERSNSSPTGMPQDDRVTAASGYGERRPQPVNDVFRSLQSPPGTFAPAAARTGAWPAVEVFYADMPDPQGGFPIDRLSRETGKYSLYEIHSQSNPTPGTSATLTLCKNADAHQIAMTDHRPFLMLACDYPELPTAGNTRIEQTGAGRVTFQGDRWHIADKVRIRFS